MNKTLDQGLMNTELTIPLPRLTRADLGIAGGKGANLGELVRAGFPVPPGFVITTMAYDRFVMESKLYEVLQGGKDIQAAFESAPVPPEVEERILAAYRELGDGPVAVRSSATAEDLPEAAFAGQQDTYLNITAEAALLEAVRRCWASLWNERAIAYRGRQNIDPSTVKLAVVVQRMVQAEAAGVLFTANPVSGARDEIHIAANPGLGEAVVSGLVTPDQFVLRRGRFGWRVIERQVGKREVVIEALEGGGTRQVARPATNASEKLTGASARRMDAPASLTDEASMLPDAAARLPDAAARLPDTSAKLTDAPAGQPVAPALPDAALRKLARLGTAIQRHFGWPQDVEWAWAAGQVTILQARPMTALPEAPPRSGLAQRMLANNFIEMLPVRPYPLDLDTWLTALGSAVEPLFALMGLDWQLIELFDESDGVVLRYTMHFPRPTWKTLLAPARLAARMLRYDPLHWRADPLLAEMIARARAMEARDPRALSWQELLAGLAAAQEISLCAAGEVRTRYFARAAFAAARLRLLLQLVGQGPQFGTLLSSAENMTLEMNRALEGLAARVRSEPALAAVFAAQPADALAAALEGLPAGRAFLAELRAFLDSYGHRETVISTASAPVWKDAPEVALGIIKGFAAYPPAPPAGPPAWQAARDEILEHRLFRLAPLRRVFLHILDEARTLIQIREDTHFYATLALPVFRRTLLEMGRRLAEAGVLDSAMDVFHLRLAELERAGERIPSGPDLAAQKLRAELHEAVQRRKAARERLENTPLVDPRILPSPTLEGDTLLRGMAGSPGVAEGPARIVMDSAAFAKLAPGDVLVAPYTNPAWTPLFQRAAAVVVDTGSLASHAAIVAREYGIPAVMATGTGTRTLRDGEWIQVDGSRGTVRRVEQPGTTGKD